MASEKTPNLGLNQIDRTSPKTTYFDLEKYLDQNWRAVDDFAGDVNDGVNEIKKRLDTTERKAVTLEPGVQIVHAEKAAPFLLTGLNGRTLVNLLGRMGNCEIVSEWSSNVAIAIDSNNKTNGSSSFKITLGSVPATASASFLTTPGRKYIAIADVKSGNTSKVAISINGVAAAKGNEVTSVSAFAPSVVRFAATDYFHIVTVTGTGVAGNTFNMDSVRVYEISEADYVAVASLTPAQIAAKYPYVDSVMPVRNPYAIRYGENILPSFYEWSAKQGAPNITDRNSVSVTVDNKIVHTVLPLVPGQKYTVSVQSGGATGRITVTDEPETKVLAEAVGVGLLTATFTANQAVNIRLLGTSSTAVTISDPMLNIGSTAKPFKPREDSMLALRTDLYADPITGANADTVFERDGQYFKTKRFESILLDGGRISKVNNVVSGTGFKALYPVVPDVNYQFVGTGTAAVKFDGKILLWGGQDSVADRWAIDGSAPNFAISVSVADSGWGDSYAPTLDDIKAYFHGYKAYDANTITPAQAQAATTATWTGTGTKYWVQRVGSANFTQTVPQTSYAGYTPYQLVYQLATPTVEPIVSEGQLAFVEGDNQVEVGTGIVLREAAKPATSTTVAYTAINAPDSVNYAGSIGTRYKLGAFLGIYSNNKIDTTWTVKSGGGNGNYYADKLTANYDQSAAYSVTYLMLDKSPVVPFTGSYAANEKTLLSDLVDSVQQNTARVSVLENKKADKDSPTWIAPTLINGVVLETPSTPVGYRKSSNGVVTVQGSVKLPTAPGSFKAFVLPSGYRPSSQGAVFLCAGLADGVDILVRAIIASNGEVTLISTSSSPLAWIRLNAIQFIAEQ
ncbi:hypothetical protein [Paenibacillus sp. JJ1722]|uniref:hypothetical protein n=1 Tax=Paenibacillus sp. JJ1722 TaxID=3398770 RepID=UPI003AAE0407